MASCGVRQQCCRHLRPFNATSRMFLRRLGSSPRGRQGYAAASSQHQRPYRAYETDDSAGQRRSFQKHRTSQATPFANNTTPSAKPRPEILNPVHLELDGQVQSFSPILLRDLCSCPGCIDPSTKQKHFATADIPLDIQSRTARTVPEGVSIEWDNDVPGYEQDHKTTVPLSVLRQYLSFGSTAPRVQYPERVFWDAEMFDKQVPDIDYEAYMTDDSVLLHALRKLHTHGLIFVTNVPESEKSVEAVGERIGPLKTTFYGKTWDVRSVPDAINVAYTAQNLGFHMDLMYMKQPPHLQLLHCIRSSAKGGASLFTDSFKAVSKIAETDMDAYRVLAALPVEYHYDHAGSQYYHQSRPVIEEEQRRAGPLVLRGYSHAKKVMHDPGTSWVPELRPSDFLESVAWSPPFQAPFAATATNAFENTSEEGKKHAARSISSKMQSWLGAARKFNGLIHRPEAIYERLMKPGECVIFDNRRVLHARRAFQVGDAGTERWLRGAYLDKDPYESKFKVLKDSKNSAKQSLREKSTSEAHWNKDTDRVRTAAVE